MTLRQMVVSLWMSFKIIVGPSFMHTDSDKSPREIRRQEQREMEVARAMDSSLAEMVARHAADMQEMTAATSRLNATTARLTCELSLAHKNQQELESKLKMCGEPAELYKKFESVEMRCADLNNEIAEQAIHILEQAWPSPSAELNSYVVRLPSEANITIYRNKTSDPCMARWPDTTGHLGILGCVASTCSCTKANKHNLALPMVGRCLAGRPLLLLL